MHTSSCRAWSSSHLHAWTLCTSNFWLISPPPRIFHARDPQTGEVTGELELSGYNTDFNQIGTALIVLSEARYFDSEDLNKENEVHN
jgi:hypothetical protein